jgi:hypothetical protein
MVVLLDVERWPIESGKQHVGVMHRNGSEQHRHRHHGDECCQPPSILAHSAFPRCRQPRKAIAASLIFADQRLCCLPRITQGSNP